jgi:phosphonate metabolism protein PhnN/1,5-bisphosphokinase (PRPP-forming)
MEETTYQFQNNAAVAAMPAARLGRLVLVVGPSGAGKDRLIGGAKAQLAADHGFHFPRREVTRPVHAGSEDHIAITERQFHEGREAGRYFLSWRAHGLGYGIPADISVRLLAGVDVVANVSRGVIGDAMTLYPRTEVTLVTAPASVLAERLSVRGREAESDIERRLECSDKPLPAAPAATIVNDGAFEHALHTFLDFLAKRPQAGGAQ